MAVYKYNDGKHGSVRGKDIADICAGDFGFEGICISVIVILDLGRVTDEERKSYKFLSLTKTGMFLI